MVTGAANWAMCSSKVQGSVYSNLANQIQLQMSG